jgi:serine/threonine protein kinase
MLTSQDLKSIAVQLSTIFKRVVDDMRIENARGIPQKHFVPGFVNIFARINPQKNTCLGVVVPRFTAMRDAPKHEATWAPELYGGGPCTEASVVYAYGVIVASICSKNVPKIEYDPSKQASYTISGKQKTDLMGDIENLLGTQMRFLIAQCLESDPADRPTLLDIERRVKNIHLLEFENAANNNDYCNMWKNYYKQMEIEYRSPWDIHK